MKISLPEFLKGKVTVKIYKRWLQRKAAAHVRRDRKRSIGDISVTSYKELIHEAVLRSRGLDAYTGDTLNWQLISKYRNEKAAQMRYKKRFNFLPTVDHCHEYKKKTFKICSWITNRMKSDMTEKEFIKRCKKVISHLSHAQ